MHRADLLLHESAVNRVSKTLLRFRMSGSDTVGPRNHSVHAFKANLHVSINRTDLAQLEKENE